MTTSQGDGLPSREQIQWGIASFLRSHRDRPQRKEVAFYGGSFTGLSQEEQRFLLERVQPFLGEHAVNRIRISTRPDVIDRRGLSLLRGYGVYTVEIGAQSMVDEILATCQRGHTARDVEESVQLLRSMGFEVGIQIMLGLPGEDLDCFLTTVERVIELDPDFVRIYPLVVLKGSPLVNLYRMGRFAPIVLDEAVLWGKKALRLFEKAGIPVIRLGLQATPLLETAGTVVAGPYHPAFRYLVESSVFYDMATKLLRDAENGGSKNIRFRVAPEDRSNIQGSRKNNLTRLEAVFGLGAIDVLADPEIPKGNLALEKAEGVITISRWQR
jgi:histone acetyltransferase (RNA polymerase elongator complex component)